jgi:hypothetical protein
LKSALRGGAVSSRHLHNLAPALTGDAQPGTATIGFAPAFARCHTAVVAIVAQLTVTPLVEVRTHRNVESTLC